MSFKKSKKEKRYKKNKAEAQKYHLKRTLHGTIDINQSGNGYFVCPQLERDLFIAKERLHSAQNKDQVEVTVYVRKGKKRDEGEVTKVLKRYKSLLSGHVCATEDGLIVIPGDRKIKSPIILDPFDEKNPVEGQKVTVKISEWGENGKPHKGNVLELLGKKGENQAEIRGILVENGLPYQFPKAVENELKNLNLDIEKEEIDRRRDMRNRLTFTIDPVDAKDFDDAISFYVLPNGNYEIGIHIADVSHYVKEGSALDQEAYQRATSVYMVDRVVPMLPEALSNRACSLRPHEEKYTFSAVFEMTPNAKVANRWFGRTAIYSDRRFSYEEAQHIITVKKGKIPADISLTQRSYEVENHTTEALLTLNDIAEKMRSDRMAKGAISFDKMEVKFELDDNSDPIGVTFKESKEANKLIEEFMLLANRSVATYIGKERKLPFVYRIHDKPDLEKLSALQNIIKRFGYSPLNLKSGKEISSSLNTLLKDINGSKEQHLIGTLAIRSMQKAEYSTKNIGHYGLAFDHYTHFTSPIRRYPDIMAHRLLQHYLKSKSAPDIEPYESQCKHCSQMESTAVNAERESVKYMQIRYLELHQKPSYVGIISGVTDRGVYVEITENGCEGLALMKDIKGDYYRYDPSSYAITGARHGKVYQLGDKVSVSIKSLDIDKRCIFFKLNTL